MKIRIISGVIGAALALIVLFLLPAWALNIAVALLGIIAVYELMVATGILKHKGVLACCMVYAAAVPFFCFADAAIALAVTVVFAVAVCILQVVEHEKLPVKNVGFAFFVTLLVSFALSSVAYLRHENNGLLYVLLTLVIPWMSDTGAYFTGTLCGKHKLCPKISPKKTIEGLIGGVIVSVGCTVLTAWLYGMFGMQGDMAVNWLRVALTALVLAPISVFGDLFASIVKRQTGIKDYGNLMPGHGGVMDRFDSVLPTAALLYVIVQFFPLIQPFVACK